MTERAKQWQHVVREWERSGQTQRAFCRERKINPGTFAWWKRQLPHAADPAPKRRGRSAQQFRRFVEVRLPAAAPGYEIVLARGRILRIPAAFDPHTLARLITTVETC